jgi:hypothetical protein
MLCPDTHIVGLVARRRFPWSRSVQCRGHTATRDEFVASGYPAWCWVTGCLEILTAALIAVPLVRGAGIVLGAVVILAAVATLLRHRPYAHLPPAVAFLLGIAPVVLAS